MQTLVQVICTPGPSLRQKIVHDRQLDAHCLEVTEFKRPGRPHGWAKVRSTDPTRFGAINIEWDSDTSVLLCRVVNRGAGKPNLIIGDFVDYLPRRFRKRIKAINILPT